MAFALFHAQAGQLISALEARGRQFLRSSTAQIPFSDLEDPPTADAFHRLTRLPYQLHLTCGKKPLSLADARAMYKSAAFDTLCRILNRLQWSSLCNQLEPLDGFITASTAFHCIHALLNAYSRVQPPSNEVARLETFDRY